MIYENSTLHEQFDIKNALIPESAGLPRNRMGFCPSGSRADPAGAQSP